MAHTRNAAVSSPAAPTRRHPSSEGKRTDFADAAELNAYLGDKLSRCEVVLEEPADVAQAWAFVTCSYQTSNSRTVVYAKEMEGWDSRPSE